MSGKFELVCSVLRIKRYALIAAVSAACLGVIYYFLTMSMLSAHLGAAQGSVPYIAASVGLTAAVSALAGVNFAMMAYKIKRMRMMNSVKSTSSTILGGAFAAFTPGCPACTAPLAVILAAVGGLSLFPLQGLELKLVSVGVLVFSVYWIARGLQSRSCCKIE